MPQPRPQVTKIKDISGLGQMSPGGEGARGKTAQRSIPGPGIEWSGLKATPPN